MTTFKELGLSNRLLKPISAAGYKTPTPIQEQAIPLALQGHDIMGLAQTGTGKTAAFGLPLIQQLIENGQKPKPKSVRALILAPTRELVNQISDNLRQYVKKTPVWINVVIGGANINTQRRTLANGSDIVVATPGRLLDLVKRDAIHLDTVKYLVLDEADQMLDLGFIHSLREIASLLARPRQTMLFSATMPKQVESLAQTYLDDPVRVEVAPPGKAADKITQCVHHVTARNKANLLRELLVANGKSLSLVFARTKHGAEKLKNHLVDHGFLADSIHGNKSQGQRDRAIRSFKKQEIEILVATDVAARGIDIPGVSHVYNFNLPEVAEAYVHRIGRTARAGKEGEAIAFCAPEELHLLKQIERLMAISIPVASGDEPEGNIPKGRNTRSRNTQGRGKAKLRTHRKQRTSEANEQTEAPKKKFRNKQITVAEFDAKENRRKNRQENRTENQESGRRNRNSRRNRHNDLNEVSRTERLSKVHNSEFNQEFSEKPENERKKHNPERTGNRKNRRAEFKEKGQNQRGKNRTANKSNGRKAKFTKNENGNFGRKFGGKPSQNRSKRRENA